MRRIIINIMVLTSIFGLFGCYGQSDPSTWNSEKTDKWFEKGDWHKGWSVTPDNSINKSTLAKAYYKNSARWDKAFAFLKDNDLKKLELKRYDLDGDNLYVTISEYTTKNLEETKYEVHKKYIDIQYIVTGSELIGIAPLTSQEATLQPYNATKDVEYLTVKKGVMVQATPAKFFIFFPEDAHMPSLKDGANSPVRKAVVKVRVD
jgi:YhcH/YjgK/YiaL family protein